MSANLEECFDCSTFHENLLDVSGDSQKCSNTEVYFDIIIGHIEDILIDEKFNELQTNFMEKHYRHFDESEENKFIYMDIFKEYIDTIEKYIETHLVNSIEDFDMSKFIETIELMKTDLDGEIFDMLFTFTDFLAFKQMFLDYKAMKEGRAVDFSSGIQVKSIQSNPNDGAVPCFTDMNPM